MSTQASFDRSTTRAAPGVRSQESRNLLRAPLNFCAQSTPPAVQGARPRNPNRVSAAVLAMKSFERASPAASSDAKAFQGRITLSSLRASAGGTLAETTRNRLARADMFS